MTGGFMETATPAPTAESASGLLIGAKGAKRFRHLVDRLFDFFDDSKPDNRFVQIPLETFRAIDCTAYFGLHDDEGLLDISGLDEKGHPLHWPIDICCLSGSAEESHIPQFARYRTREPSEVRGKARIVSKYIVQVDVLMLEPYASGTTKRVCATTYMALVNRRWVCVSSGGGWSGVEGHSIRLPARTADHTDLVSAAIAVAQRAHFEWFVEIGRDDGISFRFATSPDKLGAIFRLRDLPDGESRRKALRNWVSSHWRSNRRDPAFEVYVRQHLRGAEEFRWDGFFCRVSPSPHDLELNKALRAERADMGLQARRERFELPRVRVPAIIRRGEARQTT